AVSMLPPSPAAPAKTETKTPSSEMPALEIAPLKPERGDATPVRAHEALNVPAPFVTKEPSVEALPPPPKTPPSTAAPMGASDSTSEALLLPVTSRVPRSIPRRTLFIVGGAASGVIVLVIAVVAMSHASKPAATGGKAPLVATKAPEPVAPTTPTPTAPPTAPPPTPTPAPTGETANADTPTAAPTPPRPRRTLGGKKVVLEYDPKP